MRLSYWKCRGVVKSRSLLALQKRDHRTYLVQRLFFTAISYYLVSKASLETVSYQDRLLEYSSAFVVLKVSHVACLCNPLGPLLQPHL